MMERLALCVIAEGDNKLDNLKLLYESIHPYVEAIYLTANGGSDNESTKALEAWCKEKGINYTYFKWNDNFAEQRNFNFSQVENHIDYILWADSDDVIVGGQHLRKIADIAAKNEHDAVFFSYWYGCKFNGEPHPKTFKEVELTQMRERLIRPNSIVWKGRLHETPIPVNGQNYKYSKIDFMNPPQPDKGKYPVAWMHLGASRDMSVEAAEKRMNRNRKLLELQLEDERMQGDADPRTLLYLMKIYAESKEEAMLKECISMGEEYMVKSGWDAERAICASLMAKCMGNMGNDKEASDFLHKAISEYPHDPLLYLHLARSYFNQENYRAMKHWMNVALSIDLDDAHTNFNNILELKILSSELFLKYYLTAERNAQKAWEAAKQLYEVNPTEDNKQNEEYLHDLADLNEASLNVDKYIEYLESIGEIDKIIPVIDSMPQEMKKLPFATNLYNKYSPPRVWGEKEICYFANFSNNHFERWSPKSLEKGIGGSETAVIQLSKQWTTMGYKVTVYGDPGKDEGEHDGVVYLPWYKFNPKDKFNIFIQWRSSHLAGKISCRKFYVDLHDVFYEYDHLDKLEGFDSLMVKSNYHQSLAPNIPDHKFTVISNGI